MKTRWWKSETLVPAMKTALVGLTFEGHTREHEADMTALKRGWGKQDPVRGRDKAGFTTTGC